MTDTNTNNVPKEGEEEVVDEGKTGENNDGTATTGDNAGDENK